MASCLLNPSEIAAPVRKVFRGSPNLRFRQGRVLHVDLDEHHLTLDDATRLHYDVLVLATGSATNYYGNAEVERHALGLKDLGGALHLRNHVLECFEQAASSVDPDDRARLLTFCVVGAGPTGVEYAGALAEFVRLVVPDEYPELRHTAVRIVLLEGGDRVLPTFKRRPVRLCAARARGPRRGGAPRCARRLGRRDAWSSATVPSSGRRRWCGRPASARRTSSTRRRAASTTRPLRFPRHERGQPRGRQSGS